MTLTLGQKPPERRRHADGRDRDPPRAPPDSVARGEDLQRLQHLVHVVKRLPHTHENEVGQLCRLGQPEDLVHDLARRQVRPQSLPPRHAEVARHAASHLRRDAERVSLLGRDIDRLHETPRGGFEEVLHRPVLRPCRLRRLACAHGVARGQHFPLPQRDVGHFRHLRHAFLVQPISHLTRRVGRQTHLRGHCAQLRDGHPQQTRFLLHFPFCHR